MLLGLRGGGQRKLRTCLQICIFAIADKLTRVRR